MIEDADYKGDEQWHDTDEEQKLLKATYLDGVPATMFRNFAIDVLGRTQEGRYNATERLFVLPYCDEFIAYIVTNRGGSLDILGDGDYVLGTVEVVDAL